MKDLKLNKSETFLFVALWIIPAAMITAFSVGSREYMRNGELIRETIGPPLWQKFLTALVGSFFPVVIALILYLLVRNLIRLTRRAEGEN